MAPKRFVKRKQPKTKPTQQTVVTKNVFKNDDIKLFRSLTQPIVNGTYTFKSVQHFQLVGGSYHFLNAPFACSLYRVRTGISTVWPGLTNVASRFQTFVPLQFHVKLTVSNNTAYPTSLNLTPMRVLIAGGQTSLVTDYLLPYTKQAILGSIDGSSGQKTISHCANMNSLFGYDTTVTNLLSHVTDPASNPPYGGGIQFVAYCVDGSSIPSIAIRAEYTITVRGVYPIPLKD